MTAIKTLPLEDCMEAIIDYRGKSPSKTTYGVPLVTAKIIKGGRIAPAEEFIAEEDYENWMSRGIPRDGDVVLTTEAPLGEVAQLDGSKVALAQRRRRVDADHLTRAWRAPKDVRSYWAAPLNAMASSFDEGLR